MGKALLIIDMQKGSFIPSMPRFRRKEVCSAINSVSNHFREMSHLVVHIQHDGSKEACFVPQTEEWEIIEDIEVQKGDQFISKTANDSFYESELQDLLVSNKIRDLYIGGCASDFCVNASVQTALTLNYNVKVIKDGHTSTDRDMLSADKIVSLFNYIWSNLTPTLGSVELKTSEEIVKQ